MTVVRLEQREPFVTQDGSTIRELAGLPTGNAANQSLAQATVQAGGETEEHFHRQSEEIYLFTDGDHLVSKRFAATGGRRAQICGGRPTQSEVFAGTCSGPLTAACLAPSLIHVTGMSRRALRIISSADERSSGSSSATTCA